MDSERAGFDAVVGTPIQLAVVRSARTRRALSLCLMLSCWWCSVVVALAAELDPSSARFRHFERADGLSQVSAIAMAEDPSGDVWIGTQSGLNRVDGVETRVYQPATQINGISNAWITALAIDAEGDLWVGTLTGLDRYRRPFNDFEPMSGAGNPQAGLAAGLISSLQVDRQQRLWVGHEQGVSLWQAREQRFVEFSWRESDRDQQSGRVFAICDDGAEGIWVGTARGLGRLELGSRQLVRFSNSQLANERINALHCDQDGVVWIGTDTRGLFRFDPLSQRWLAPPATPDDARELRVHALLRDRQQRMWMATDAGLDELKLSADGGIEVLRYRYRRKQPTGLGRGVVVSLLQTRDDTLWAGTWQSGVSLLNAQFNRMLSFGSQHPATSLLRDDAVRGLALLDDLLWLGSADGLFRFDWRSAHLGEVPRTGGWNVNAIVEWDDAVWVATRVGVYRFDRDGKPLSLPQLPPAFRDSRVRILYATADALWASIDGHGVYRVGRDRNEAPARFEIVAPVAFITQYDADRVIAGAQDGLYWFSADGRELLHVHRPASGGGLNNTPVPISNFLRARDGRQWLATSGLGIMQLRLPPSQGPEDAEFVPLQERPANAFLNCLVEDSQGRIWASTDGGISRFDPPPASQGQSSVAGRWFNYDHQDGSLPGYFFSAMAKLPDGRIAFGGGGGFTLLDPDQIGEWSPPPSVRMRQLWLNNQLVSIGGEVLPVALDRLDQLQLRAEQARSVVLSFGAAEFINPKRLLYSYRLDPFESEWVIDQQGSRRATYTNLAPGEYRFRVRSGSAESGWSQHESELRLSIEPPWWGTWWARALGMSLLAGLLFAVYRTRVQWIEASRRKLESEVRLRTAELQAALQTLTDTQRSLIEQEKMASLGGLVAGVAHEINTPLGVALTAGSHLQTKTDAFHEQITGGKLTRADLEHFVELCGESSAMICRNLERAAQLVQSFKQVSVDRTSEGRRRFELHGFIDELVESSRSLWRGHPVELRIRCEQNIRMDSFPGPLGQVLINLIQNALLHAFPNDRAGTVQIAASKIDDHSVCIEVSDDGQGMSHKVAAQVFEPFFTTKRNEGGTGLGLHVVFNLVTQKLGGRIEVDSEPAHGTRFRIELPLSAPRGR